MDWAEIIKKLVPVIIDIVAPMLKGKEAEVTNAILLTEQTKGLSSNEKLLHAMDKFDQHHYVAGTNDKLEEVIDMTVKTANELTK